MTASPIENDHIFAGELLHERLCIREGNFLVPLSGTFTDNTNIFMRLFLPSSEKLISSVKVVFFNQN